MDNITELFSDFTAKMLERSLQEYKRVDTEFQEIDNYISIHTPRFNQVIESLGDEEQTFLTHYIDMRVNCIRCTNEGMYIAGYKDCVKLLKHLGVL